MKCVDCGSDSLLGLITIEKAIPLAQKGGGLNMKGQKVGQIDIKDAWLKDPSGNEKGEYGPIVCALCGAEHVYVPGGKPTALRLKE